MARKSLEETEVKNDDPIDDTREIENLKAKLAALESKVAEKDKELDEIKKKEEGWLVWGDNPTYNGVTLGIQFTDGMAFVPKTRFYPRFKIDMPAANQVESMEATERGKKQLEEIRKASERLTSERAVNFLTKDFNYHAQFFTKDQQEELQKRITLRAQERKDALEKKGTESELLEKLMVSHRINVGG